MSKPSCRPNREEIKAELPQLLQNIFQAHAPSLVMASKITQEYH